MAATPVEVVIGVSGLTGLTLRLYPLGMDALANAPGDALTEQTSRDGTYRATVEEALSGVYEAYVLDADGDVFFYGFLYLEDTTGVWTVADDLASARAHVDCAAIQAKTSYLPSVTPGQAGGLLVAGANAATSIAGLTANITGNLTGNLSGSVGSVATGGISAASFAAGAINAAAIATNAIDADAIAADAVTEIQAGLATAASQTTIIGYIDTEVAAIKAKTDYLPSATAGQAGGLFIAGANAATTVNITGNLTGNVSGSVGSVTGNVAGSVGSVAAGGITAASFAANSITASAVASDAVTEMQAGLATAASQTTIIGYLDTEIAAILAAVDTEVAAIKAKTDYLPSATAGQAGGVFIAGANATTSVAGLTTSITGSLSGSVGAVAAGGISAASFDTGAIDANALSADAVAELVAGINGQGARTVTITIDDGTNRLEGARVRLTKGAETYLQTTDASGQCTFNVDDGTWLVAITLVGYEFSGTPLLIDRDTTVTYSLNPYTISPPAAPNLTTGYVLCLGTDGLPEVGVTISAQMTAGPGADGYALDTETVAMVSGSDGIAQHTGFVRGAAYKFRRGTSAWWTAAQVAPNATTWNLREILGTP